jgi:hypothetical protein
MTDGHICKLKKTRERWKLENHGQFELILATLDLLGGTVRPWQEEPCFSEAAASGNFD